MQEMITRAMHVDYLWMNYAYRGKVHKFSQSESIVCGTSIGMNPYPHEHNEDYFIFCNNLLKERGDSGLKRGGYV